MARRKRGDSGRGARGRRRATLPAGRARVRALAHPLRLRLLELFAERPRTTMQAAQALGEAPTRLYHHVAALERAGLVRLRERRPNRGTVEKYFEAVGKRIPAGDVVGRPEATHDYERMGYVLFDQAHAELVRALAAETRPATLIAVRGVYRLTPGGARRMSRELVAVLKRKGWPKRKGRGAAPPPARGRRYSLTIAFLPMGDDRTARGSKRRP